MKKTLSKKKILCAIVLVFLLSLLFFYFTFFFTRNLGHGFSRAIEDSLAQNASIDFDAIAPFAWDRLLIIGPYSPIDNILARGDLRWPFPSRAIESTDTITLLLFVRGNRVVAFSELSRSVFDFASFGHYHGQFSFTRNEAVFVSGR